MTRLKYRRPDAVHRSTSAPPSSVMPRPARVANSGGAAEYMSVQARASAASMALALRGPDSRLIPVISRPLHGAQVSSDDLHRAPVLLGRAELDDLGAGLDDRDVPGRGVVGVAGLVALVVVREPERDLAPHHVAPVRALA